MCTVSFVPVGESFVITSNRDEEVLRPSFPPKTYFINGQNITFPKDPRAGGTWFAINESGSVAVLLNGAKTAHKRNPPYRKSRGLVVLDCISQHSPQSFWEKSNLDNIEPFTLVVFESGNLIEFQWDGFQKSEKALQANRAHFWSSATLYLQPVREERKKWFDAFLSENLNTIAVDLLEFHNNSHSANQENGLVINRQNTLKTLSITQVEVFPDKMLMNYRDLESREFTQLDLPILAS